MHHKKKNGPLNKQDWKFSKKITEVFAKLAFQLSRSPSLLGQTSFIIIIAAEYLFMAIMIIVATYPQKYEEEDVSQNSQQLSQEYNIYFHMFPHNEKYNAFSDVPNIMVFIIAGTFGLNICIFGIILSNFRKEIVIWPLGENVSFPLKLVSTWIMIQRTLLSYLFAYSITASAIIFNTTSNNSSQLPSKEYYILLALIIFGTISFLLTGFLSFEIVRAPLFVRTFYWNSSASICLYIKELFKFAIIAQDCFLNDKAITSSQVTHSGYLAFLLVYMIILNFYRPPKYFDSRVNKINNISIRLVLCVCLLAFIRTTFLIGLVDLLFYSPIVIYTILKSISVLEQRLSKQGITKYLQVKQGTADETKDTLQYLIQILYKLRKDSIGASCQTESELTEEQERILVQLNYNHKIQCCRITCICHHYDYICVDQFKQFLVNQVDEEQGPFSEGTMRERKHTQRKNKHQIFSPRCSRDYIDESQTNNNLQQPSARVVLEKGAKIPIISQLQQTCNTIKNPQQSANHQQMDVSQNPIETRQKLLGNFSTFNGNDMGTACNMPTIGEATMMNIQSQYLPEMQSNDLPIRVADLFQNSVQQPASYQSENYQPSGAHNNTRYSGSGQLKLKGVEQFKSTEEFLQAIKLANFKNIYEARDYYFSQLIGTIVEEYYLYALIFSQQTYSNQATWMEYRLLYFQFLCVVLHRPFFSVYNLLQMKYQKHNNSRSPLSNSGILSRIKFRLCELILVNEVQSIIDDEQLESTQVSGNFSEYIELGNKLKYLDFQYDSTAFDIAQFWKQWNTPEPSVQNIFVNGKIIAQKVGEIKKISSHMSENSSILFTDIYRYNMHILFHQNLLNDPVTANNMMNALRNFLMFRTKNKMSGNLAAKEAFSRTNGLCDENSAQSDSQFSDNAVCLVSANDGDFRNLSFVYGNKAFLQLTGATENILQGMNIKAIMPKSIREVHDYFIKRFFTFGNHNLMGKPLIIFVKDLHGIIRPCTFKLLFTYDPKFKYAFITQFERLNNLSLIGTDNVKLPMSDCMVFLTDDKYEISEVSQGVLNYCGFNGNSNLFKNAQDNKGKSFSLEQFIVNLNEVLYKDQTHQVFGVAAESNIQFKNKLVNVRRYHEEVDDCLDSDTFLAVLSYFEEPLPSPNDCMRSKIRVFIMVPLSKHPEADMLIKIGNYSDSIMIAVENLVGIHRLNSPIGGGGTLQNDDYLAFQSNLIGNELHLSSSFDGNEDKMDLSSQSSGMSSVDSGIDSAFYLKNILFQTKSPRILRISIYILMSMFSAFLVVSLYNLSIFLVNHQEIEARIQAYYFASNTLVRFRMVILNLKVLHRISNDQDVFKLDKSTLTGKRFSYYEKNLFDVLKLANYASQKFDTFNIEYRTNYNFDVEFKNAVFLSDKGTIDRQNMTLKHQNNLFSSYIEDMNFTQLYIDKPPMNVSSYPFKFTETTTVQRQLYFIFENGIKEMQQVGMRQIQLIVKTSQDQITSSILTLNITTYISVAIVSTIMLALIPVFIKLFSRQYTIFRFFQFLTKEHTEQIIEQCNEYLIKMVQNPGDQLVSKKLSNGTVKVESENKLTGNLKTATSKLKTSLSKKQIKDDQAAQFTKINAIQEEDEEYDQEESSEDGEIKEKKKHHHHHNKKREEKPQISESISLSLSKQQCLESQISKRRTQEKIGILIFIAFCIGYLNSSLLVSQYFSNNVFVTNNDSTEKMRIYFKREICAYNILLYMSESYLQNYTIPIKVYDVEGKFEVFDSVKYYIQYCMVTETHVSEISKSLPNYLVDAQGILAGMEGPGFCNQTQIVPLSQQACTQAMDGLLTNGFDAVMSYLINFITQLEINFSSEPSIRTQKWLDQNARLPRLSEIIDLTVFYLRNGFLSMQNAVVMSINNYFAQQKVLYLVVFISYISCTLLIALLFGLVVFKKIKDNLLDIQNILVLLPFSDFDPQQRQKIEQYLAK